MPTAAERQALAFLAGVALLGGGVRVWQQRHPDTFGAASAGLNVSAESVDGQLGAIDAARSSKRGKKGAGKPKSASKSTKDKRPASKVTNEMPAIIDVDVATAQQLEKLPRVGMALADRIVANRDSLGAFGSLEALGSVRGIGDAMLKTLDPLVTFSGRPRARAASDEQAVSGRRKRVRKDY